MKKIIEQLIESLDYIWFVKADDKENDCHGLIDTNGNGMRFCASRTEIKLLIIDLMDEFVNVEDFIASMDEVIVDELNRFDIDEHIYAASYESAIDQVNSIPFIKREINFSWLFLGFQNIDNLTKYREVCIEIASSIDIDISFISNDLYWDICHDEKILPAKAVINLKNSVDDYNQH
jgi:hypothetical protein